MLEATPAAGQAVARYLTTPRQDLDGVLPRGRVRSCIHAPSASSSASTSSTLVAAWPSRSDRLTSREQEIVKLIAEAHTNGQIAEMLVISKKTVERHRANVLEKLG